MRGPSIEKHETEKTGKKSGFIFLGLSVLFYLLMAVIPFLGFDAGTSVVIITVFVVIAELSFLAGIYVLGRELAGKYRAYFNPLNWFRKRKPIAEKEEESSHSE